MNFATAFEIFALINTLFLAVIWSTKSFLNVYLKLYFIVLAVCIGVDLAMKYGFVVKI